MGKVRVTPEKDRHNAPLCRDGSFTSRKILASIEPFVDEKKEDDYPDMHRLSIKSLSNLSEPSSRLTKTSSGFMWSTAMDHLGRVGSIFEAVSCLRDIEDLLIHIEFDDRIAFCKEDFTQAVETLRKNPIMNTPKLLREILRITTTYFNENKIRLLPDDIIHQIFVCLPMQNMVDILSTCKNWHRIGLSKPVWQEFYSYRFLPEPCDRVIIHRPKNDPDEIFDNDRRKPLVTINMLRSSRSCYALMRSRILSPLLGDLLEVLWRGKFRLDDVETYNGCGWWKAEVRSGPDDEGNYAVQYVGWGNKWEEKVNNK